MRSPSVSGRRLSPAARGALAAAALLLLTALLIPGFASPRAVVVPLAIGAAIGAAWLVAQPHWGVIAILIVWFLEVDPVGIRYLSIPYVVSAVLVVPLASALLRDRTIWAWRVPQFRLLLGIGLVMLASTAWSALVQPDTPFPALDQTGRTLHLFATRLGFFVLLLYFVRTRRHIGLVALVLVALAAVVAVDALHPFLGGSVAGRARSQGGLTENANRLAYVALFGASLTWFFRADARSRWGRALALPVLLFFLATALFAGSRSGFLQLLIFTAFLLKEQQGWSPARRIHSFVILLCLAVALAVIVPSAQLLRVTTFDPAVFAPGQASLRNRVNTVVAALELSIQNPVLGVGVGNFRWRHQLLDGNDRETHNSYLWALAGGGPGLLLLYLLLFYATHRMVLRAERFGPPDLRWLSKALRVNLVLFLVFSAFADFWLSEFFYVIVGLAVVLSRLADSARGRSRTPLPPRPAFATA